MKQRFARYKRTYGQRWQVETVNSMIKRRLGSALRARQYESQCREIILKALTHNVMIIQRVVLYRAAASPFRIPVRVYAPGRGGGDSGHGGRLKTRRRFRMHNGTIRP